MLAVAGAVLAVAAPAAADPWGADQSATIARVSPDQADRVAAAHQADLARMLDARERSQVERPAATTPAPVRGYQLRRDPSRLPQPVAATVTGRDLAWQQIGIGFAGGVVLMVALLLALRMPRHRLPAH